MLELRSPVNDVFRPDLELADPTLLTPADDSLEAGEWLLLNTDAKGARATAVSSKAPMQVWTQKGDTAAQAIGKVTVISLQEYEAETDMFKGDDNYAIESQLTVKTITVDGVATRSGLCLAVQGDFVHAICAKTPALNGGKLRFRKRSPYVMP